MTQVVAPRRGQANERWIAFERRAAALRVQLREGIHAALAPRRRCWRIAGRRRSSDVSRVAS